LTLSTSKSGNNNYVLLNDLFTIPPRKIAPQLVGGSGAGNVSYGMHSNGLRPAQQGKVLLHGKDYYHNLAAFSLRNLVIKPQDDIVHHDLDRLSPSVA